MKKKRQGSGLKAWLYLLPAILFLGIFMVYPLIDVFVYSFEEGYNSASQTYWGVGSYNYSYVLHDPYFLQAVKNTFLLVIYGHRSAHFYRAVLHQTAPEPVSDHLFSALCDKYAGCRPRLYDLIQKDRLFRRFYQPGHFLVRRKCR